MRPNAWPRVVLLAALAGAIAFALIVASPLRAQGGDTVPGRLGAVVLVCRGDFDLHSVDWLAARARAGRLPYYAREASGGTIVSTFGALPAVIGAPAMASLRPGMLVGDRALMRRARYAAAAAVAVALGLLLIALGSERGVSLAALGGATAVLSFAGAATLGQALWQQTAALPLLVGAMATVSGARSRAGWAVLTPACVLAAVATRPAVAGVAAGIGCAWLVVIAPRADRVRLAVAAFALGGAVLLPFALWNVEHLGTPWPDGQLLANRALATGGRIFDLEPVRLLDALAGLLVSPGRGLVWYAPIVPVAVVLGLRGRDTVRRAATIGIALQVLLAAAFFKWWGGLGYGPRLVAETVWLAAWIAMAPSESASRASRRWLLGASALTIVVGLLGLYRYDPGRWEFRRNPDDDPAALWDVRDNPIAALMRRGDAARALLDAPAGPFVYCAPDALGALPPGR